MGTLSRTRATLLVAMVVVALGLVVVVQLWPGLVGLERKTSAPERDGVPLPRNERGPGPDEVPRSRTRERRETRRHPRTRRSADTKTPRRRSRRQRDSKLGKLLDEGIQGPRPACDRRPFTASNRACLPVIDSHTHISPLYRPVRTAIEIFRRTGVVKFVNKSGGRYGSPRYKAHIAVQRALGWDRFAFFINLDWRGVNKPGWGEREAKNLALAVREGAVGVKIFKTLGLGVEDEKGKLLPVDDPKLFPIWKKAGEIGAIVALHTGDPKAFFEKPGPTNERNDELTKAPSWSFYGPKFPKRETLLAQRDHVLQLFPKTTFLGIHLGNNPEDIDYVARTLERYPNFYVDVAARLGEIGRHPPAKVRRLFERFPTRILFGTDIFVTSRGYQLGSVSKTKPLFEDAIAFYRAHWHYFESSDRQIAHPAPIQGKWKIDAVGLPRPLLQAFYYDNAWKLIFVPQIARRKRWGDYQRYRLGIVP